MSRSAPCVRTGDTPPGERDRMRRRPPHILVTTPESLYVLLGSQSGRATLATTRTVIVDEIHAIAPNKRGAHLALSLERLAALCGDRLQRIGLSATQNPIEAIARLLVGAGPDGGAAAEAAIIDTGHHRPRDLALEVPASPLEAVMSAEVWEQVYDRLAGLIEAHRTTLVHHKADPGLVHLSAPLSVPLGVLLGELVDPGADGIVSSAHAGRSDRRRPPRPPRLGLGLRRGAVLGDLRIGNRSQPRHGLGPGLALRLYLRSLLGLPPRRLGRVDHRVRRAPAPRPRRPRRP